MARRLVLVGCGSEKESEKSYSWRLYGSDYFQKRLTLAMLMGEPAILSAKYGYLLATQRIEPYDEDMREKKNHQIDSWALTVSNDIPDFYEQIVILAGKKYRYPLKNILEEKGYEVFSPFDSSEISGIGDQIGWCKQSAEKIESGVEPENLLDPID